MNAMASLFTSVSVACSPVCSGAGQRKHQSSASPAFERGIHRWPVDSPLKGPVTRKMFPFDDVIMFSRKWVRAWIYALIESGRAGVGFRFDEAGKVCQQMHTRCWRDICQGWATIMATPSASACFSDILLPTANGKSFKCHSIARTSNYH